MSGRSLGEKRIRTEFNMSNSDSVAKIKQSTAEIINHLEEMRVEYQMNNSENDTEFLELINISQRKYEEAAMWAVKAYTYN